MLGSSKGGGYSEYCWGWNCHGVGRHCMCRWDSLLTTIICQEIQCHLKNLMLCWTLVSVIHWLVKSEKESCWCFSFVLHNCLLDSGRLFWHMIIFLGLFYYLYVKQRFFICIIMRNLIVIMIIILEMIKVNEVYMSLDLLLSCNWISFAGPVLSLYYVLLYIFTVNILWTLLCILLIKSGGYDIFFLHS